MKWLSNKHLSAIYHNDKNNGWRQAVFLNGIVAKMNYDSSLVDSLRIIANIRLIVRGTWN